MTEPTPNPPPTPPPNPDGPQAVTRVLAAIAGGDRLASDRLLPLVYDELRRLARQHMARESGPQTLQATALVHEAYVRLLGPDGGSALHWDSRGHFFASAAIAMRRILVEHARARHAVKRGGHAPRVTLDDVDVAAPEVDAGLDIAVLDDALTRLSAIDARQSRIVELRFFGGLTVEETAAVTGLSPRTVKREWQMSRAWLRREMSRLGQAS